MDVLLFQADLESASAQVLVISFGLREGALLWLDDTKCSFPMLLDPDRQVRISELVE